MGQADRAHSTSRRVLLVGLTATPLLSAPATAGPAPCDAALFALAPRITALSARFETLFDEASALEEKAFDLVGPPAPETGYSDRAGELMAAREASGQLAAQAASDAAGNDLWRVLAEVADTRTATLPGLVFKARLARQYDCEELADGILDDLIAIGEAAQV